jgi:hypothetical protein
LDFVDFQSIRGGLTVNVNVTSSNTTVGTITTSPVVFAGGSTIGFTEFDPASAGSTTITVGAPAGFSTPATGVSAIVTVIAPGILIDNNVSVGRNLQQLGTALLGAPAPAGVLSLTLTSNSGLLLLSTSETAAGSGSITINVPAGQSVANYYLQSLGDTGTATYTATAPGYTTKTATVLLSPSGVVIEGPLGPGFPVTTTMAQGPQPLTVRTMLLEPGTNFPVMPQALAGGMSLQVTLTSGSAGVGTVASPVTIAGGSDTGASQFTPVAAGQTTINVNRPAGYSLPSTYTSLTWEVK